MPPLLPTSSHDRGFWIEAVLGAALLLLCLVILWKYGPKWLAPYRQRRKTARRARQLARGNMRPLFEEILNAGFPWCEPSLKAWPDFPAGHPWRFDAAMVLRLVREKHAPHDRLQLRELTPLLLRLRDHTERQTALRAFWPQLQVFKYDQLVDGLPCPTCSGTLKVTTRYEEHEEEDRDFSGSSYDHAAYNCGWHETKEWRVLRCTSCPLVREWEV